MISSHTDAVNDLVWSTDGRELASASDDGFVRVWQIGSGSPTQLAEIDYDAPVYTVALNPGATKIAYGGKGQSGQNGVAEISDLNLETLPVPPTQTPV
ncbi:MAG TPA: hypothetical protein VHL11_15525 [Phototrophicaceae bacterium]|nr:hypothetical protein [Phototrophicaceae bacterium]